MTHALAFSFALCSKTIMERLSEDRLVNMALGALEEVAALCHEAPMPRTKSLALVLAYLASRQPCRRYAFDSFWRAIDHERPQDRWGNVNAALNGIYLAIGRKRDMAVVSRYEEAARKRPGGDANASD